MDRPDRYNIVGEERVSNLQLATYIAGLLGKPLHYKLVDFHIARPGHDRHYGLDGTKMAKMGWRAPVSFIEALAKTIRWTKKHLEWME